MEPARQPADRDQVREAVRSRYGGLARAAQAGEKVTDCDPGALAAGGFGAAGYPDDASGLPGGAVRASLGCGNPVAVADLHPGETVLDLGSGGGIDVLLSARRVGPARTPPPCLHERIGLHRGRCRDVMLIERRSPVL